MAQSFNVPFATIVRRVIWPGALPSILAGFRITASVALLLVVSAEMIGAEYGIGAFVLQAGNLMQTDQLLAGVGILSLFGLAVGKLINLLETRLVHWRRVLPRSADAVRRFFLFCPAFARAIHVLTMSRQQSRGWPGR